jgi:hypothetical protein
MNTPSKSSTAALDFTNFDTLKSLVEYRNITIPRSTKNGPAGVKVLQGLLLTAAYAKPSSENTQDVIMSDGMLHAIGEVVQTAVKNALMSVENRLMSLETRFTSVESNVSDVVESLKFDSNQNTDAFAKQDQRMIALELKLAEFEEKEERKREESAERKRNEEEQAQRELRSCDIIVRNLPSVPAEEGKKPGDKYTEVAQEFVETMLKVNVRCVDAWRQNRRGPRYDRTMHADVNNPKTAVPTDTIPPLVIRFANPAAKLVALRARSNLKDTKFGLDESLTKLQQETKSAAWPNFVKAKKEGKRAVWRAEKLFVDGKELPPMQA